MTPLPDSNEDPPNRPPFIRKRSYRLFRLMAFLGGGFARDRSETIEQQKYEHEILARHYPDVALSEDYSSHTDTSSHTTKQSDEVSIKDRVKGFWNEVVKPDIDTLKEAFSIETAVRKDIHDPSRYPEVEHVAEVRRGVDLSLEEKEFLTDRKWFIRDAFAKYMNVDPREVHPDDVPVIGFGGSGGGFRAMLGVLGYCDEMKKTGLWDVLTYVAGVSGSCWSLAAYYTFGEGSMSKIIDHCRKRLHPYHPLSPEAIRMVLNSPGGAYATLGPLIQKQHSGLHTVAMDLYSVFTTGYLFMINDPVLDPGAHKAPRSEVAGYHQNWYKWTNAIKYLNGGAEPLPILTAIRHERPWKDWVDSKHPFREAKVTPHAEQEQTKDAWFQWFEITPFEIGCDEIGAWVPTWGFGRPFSEGKSIMQLPEQTLALILGLCTSAPAGPLSSYLAVIKRSLPANYFGSAIRKISSAVASTWGKHGKEEFQSHHPLHACNEHNFVYHLTPTPGIDGKENEEKSKVDQFKTEQEIEDQRPPGVENSPHIHLIDSGIDNNCPTYVLLHPSRKVDVILNMDASSDVLMNTFQARVDQIASRRGMKFTRIDPPPETNPAPAPEPTKKNAEEDLDKYQSSYAQVYDSTLLPTRPETVIDSYGHTVKNPPAPICTHDCSMVYMPLLPNYRAVPGFDPSTAKFSGSYNLVWTPEQVDMLIKVCRQNFRIGEPKIKDLLAGVWKRKMEARLNIEREKARRREG